MDCGEIWLVDLENAKGHEQRGTRPAIILGISTGMCIIIPLTGSMDSARFPYTHPVTPTTRNGLDTVSIALVFQIVALDSERFRHRIGFLDEPDRLAIHALLKDLLKLD
jgi:mRNA interferase MazF